MACISVTWQLVLLFSDRQIEPIKQHYLCVVRHVINDIEPLQHQYAGNGSIPELVIFLGWAVGAGGHDCIQC